MLICVMYVWYTQVAEAVAQASVAGKVLRWVASLDVLTGVTP